MNSYETTQATTRGREFAPEQVVEHVDADAEPARRELASQPLCVGVVVGRRVRSAVRERCHQRTMRVQFRDTEGVLRFLGPHHQYAWVVLQDRDVRQDGTGAETDEAQDGRTRVVVAGTFGLVGDGPLVGTEPRQAVLVDVRLHVGPVGSRATDAAVVGEEGVHEVPV